MTRQAGRPSEKKPGRGPVFAGDHEAQLRSLRAARVLLREVLVPESDIDEPEVELELLMLEPELLGVVDVLPDEVEGVVIVLASVERPVLGVVDIVPEVEPVLGGVDIVPEVDPVLGVVAVVLEGLEPVGAAEPGFVVPVDDGVVAVGLVVDGLVLVAPGDVCACAKPTAPIRAAIEAAAVRDLENLIIDNSCSNG